MRLQNLITHGFNFSNNARWRSRYLNSLISWKSWVQVPPLHQKGYYQLVGGMRLHIVIVQMNAIGGISMDAAHG